MDGCLYTQTPLPADAVIQPMSRLRERKPPLKQAESLQRRRSKGKVRSSPQFLFAFPQCLKERRSEIEKVV